MLVIEQIWREKKHVLLTIAVSVSIDESAAEDVIQEAFARTIASRKKFDEPAKALKFLSRVTLNIAIDHYRDQRRRSKVLVAGSLNKALNRRAREAASNRFERWQAGNPLKALIGREQNELKTGILREVRRSIKTLPPRQKQALEMIFNSRDQTIKAICQENGVPYSTLRSRMLRALDRIRYRLEKRGLMERDGE